MNMKKFVLITFCLSCISTWAAVPVRPLKRPLNTLNLTLLNNKISAEMARKSFAQLVRMSQLSSLTPAEQTVLLVYKFVEENNTLPRTVIFIDRQVLSPTKYTFAQKMEVALGNQVRHLLESPNTPTEIRQDLLQLKANFSDKYKTRRTLDNLNEWLTKYHTWPRATITKQTPLTAEEKFEIDLAHQADLICKGRAPSIPDELVSQIQTVRSYYDPAYITASQKEDNRIFQRTYQKQVQQQKIQQEADLERYYGTFYNGGMSPSSRMYHFYANENLPLNPATGRQQVLPTPSSLIIKSASSVDQDQVYTTLVDLVHWLQEHPTDWPSLESIDPKTIKLAREILLIKEHPIGQEELDKLMEQYFYQLHSTPQQLLHQLQTYIAQEGHWPIARYLTIKSLAFSSAKQIREEQLANAIEKFVCWADPNVQGAQRSISNWQDSKTFMHRVLSARKPYANADLEQFRLFYQQYSK